MWVCVCMYVYSILLILFLWRTLTVLWEHCFYKSQTSCPGCQCPPKSGSPFLFQLHFMWLSSTHTALLHLITHIFVPCTLLRMPWFARPPQLLPSRPGSVTTWGAKEEIRVSHFSSVQFSHSVMSDSLQPHGLEHSRPPCPLPTPEVYSNSWPLSWWCHQTVSSSVVPFSSCLQSFPASGSFQMSQFFAPGGQSFGVSTSASVLPMNIQDWFPLGWTGQIQPDPTYIKTALESKVPSHIPILTNGWWLLGPY